MPRFPFVVAALSLLLAGVPAAAQEAPKPAAAASSAAAAAGSAEQRIREAVEKLTGRKPDGITKAGFLGLYEVLVGGELVYMDEKATVLIAGDVYDLKTSPPRNIKDERLSKLNAIRFSELPLDQSFKIVRGSGKRQLAYFSDPKCPYCKKLEKDLLQLQDVTLHVFLYPILSPESATQSKAVWCSADRGKAWIDLMVNGVTPTADGTCANPIEKNVALGQRFRITGTPTLIFENGQRVPGAVPLDKINDLLAEAAKK